MASKRNARNENDMIIKIFVLVALFIAFIGGYLIATAKYKLSIQQLSKMVIDKDAALQQIKSKTNKIMMKDDKMWVVENGAVKQMDSDIIIPNGDKVMTSGKVLRSDGTEIMMKNGESIGMDGIIMSEDSN